MTDIIVLKYQDREVTFDPNARMWNLTAMHKATGGLPHKAPAQWLRNQQTQELITALHEQENPPADVNCANLHSFVETREGRTDGTWAHWQIAAAYAHYLDPHFYLTWNEWALAHTQQQTAGASPELARLASQVAALADDVAQLKAQQSAPANSLAFPLLSEPAPPEGHPRHPLPARVVIAIFQQAGAPLTARQVVAALCAALGDAVTPTQVRVRLRRLAAQGALQKLERGLYEAARHN